MRLSKKLIYKPIYAALLLVGVSTAQAEATVNVGSVGITAYDSTSSYMLLRVGSPGGLISELQGTDGVYNWTLPGGAANGLWHYEVHSVPAGTSDESGNTQGEMESVYGSFEVNGGIMTLVVKDLGYAESLEQDVVAAVDAALNWLIPQASADDLTIIDVSPVVFFDDTDEAFVEWALTGDQNQFRLYNSDTTKNILLIDDQANMQLSIDSNSLDIETSQGFDIVNINEASPLALEIFSNGDVSLGGVSRDLCVDTSTNNTGLGTCSPADKLHVMGDVRIQSGAGNWTMWPGTATGSLYLRDNVTGDSPFRIYGGAPRAAMVVQDNGDLEFGGTAPNANAKMYIEASKATGYLPSLWMENKTGNSSAFTFVTTSGRIDLGNHNGVFRVNYLSPNDGDEMQLYNSGNMIIAGSLTQNSDVNNKHKIEELDTQSILSKVIELPISEWTYKRDEDQARHIGPMAQDFYAQFALGANERGISSIDTGGVALAAIQGLNQKLADQETKFSDLLNQKELQLRDLQAQISELAEQNTRLASLEQVVMKLIETGHAIPAAYQQ